MSDRTTEPTDHPQSDARNLTVAATYTDTKTGAVYVHRDLEERVAPWASEAHISPMRGNEAFGDVDAFAAYVIRFGPPVSTLITWNSSGLHAVLDYATGHGQPGRCQWKATMPFHPSRSWRFWSGWFNGGGLPHRLAIEKLEDYAADIVDPPSADLVNLLRSLRAHVTAKAETELRPDGTAHVTFERDQRVKTPTEVDLPPTFTIAIQILDGHTTDGNRPVLYRIALHLRVSVDENAHLVLRLSAPDGERALEHVHEDLVGRALTLLAESYHILRAAD